MVGYGGSSSLVGKPLGGEVSGRLVMNDMVQMCVSVKMGAEIREPGKSGMKGIGMRTKGSDLLDAGVDRLAPEGIAEGQEAAGRDSSASSG